MASLIDMESASKARTACEMLNHRLYALNVEKDWEGAGSQAEIDRCMEGVSEAWEALEAIMGPWVEGGGRRSWRTAPEQGERAGRAWPMLGAAK